MIVKRRHGVLLAVCWMSAVSGWPAALQAADVVLLKNGTVLEGELVNYDPKQTEIALNTGIRKVTLLRAEVRRVEVDQAARQEFLLRQNQLKADDARGQFELYKWACSKRLYSFADGALQATLKADPDHALARKATGDVYRDGRWMTADEAAQLPAPSSPGDGAVEIAETAGGEGTESQAAARTAFEKSIVEHAAALGASDGDEAKREAAVAALIRDREQSGDVLLACLDFRRMPQSETRLGALQGLRVVKPAGPRVSPSLAWSAVMDPETGVRDEAVKLIKERKDDAAVGGMIRHLMGAFDEGGEVRNAPLRDAAVRSLRALDDPRVYEAFFYYVVCEMRPTLTELTNFQTRQIDSFTVMQGGNVIIPILLSFPVQFPELGITRVRTTVSAPASALRAVTGQDFGDDVGKWRKWLNGLKK
ncbi:MAG: hypothetical protein HS116_15370 [Planctomycetes bacterium]|nr:hypothetical protein [Planctomycetota bacterium]